MGKIKDRILLPLFLVIVTILYLPVFNGFFQQDEWLAFGVYLFSGEEDVFSTLFSYFLPSGAHYVPFTHVTTYFLTSLFGLNYISFAVLSLIAHLVIVVIVFLLATAFFKNRLLALMTTGLFGLSASGFQATSWVIADIATHGAALFGVLSLILFFEFLNKRESWFFWFSIVALIASLLFKEITIALFLVLPIAFYLFGNKELVKKHFYPVTTLSIGVVYSIFRALTLFSSPTGGLVRETQTTQNLALNILTFPFKGVVQTIIPPPQVWSLGSFIALLFSDRFGLAPNTTAFDVFVQDKVLEPLSFSLFLAISVLAFVIFRKASNRQKKIAAFGLIFIGLNSVIYAFSPERVGIIHLIDSRNLYFPALGTALFLVSMVAVISKNRVSKALVLLLPIFLLNIFWLNRELTALAKAGSLRNEILQGIKNKYPDLPNQVIFYTRSDRAYYGLPPEENIMPFQSGFGQILLVWYHEEEQWPREFFQDNFLWKITEQGYKEVNGQGFGYFRDKGLLKERVGQYNIPPDSIIAFDWKSEKNTLTDITEVLRDEFR